MQWEIASCRVGVLKLKTICDMLKTEEDDVLEWAQTHFFIVWKQ